MGAIIDNTGTLSFCKDSIGTYAFSYFVSEWRKDFSGAYVLMGTIQMDFAIDIGADVGIKEFDKKELINIYPNPVNTKITIFSNVTKQTLQIFNSIGSLIHRSIIESEKTEVDLSQQPSGIYFIRIGSVTKKIIKE